MGRSNHWLVICIVSAETVDGHFATAWALPDYAQTPQACRQRPASAGQSATADYFGNLLQGCSDKTVSGSIDGQIIEPARDLPPIK
jgi:hypothetical protein